MNVQPSGEVRGMRLGRRGEKRGDPHRLHVWGLGIGIRIRCEVDGRGNELSGGHSLEKLLVFAGMHAGYPRNVAADRARRAMEIVFGPHIETAAKADTAHGESDSQSVSGQEDVYHPDDEGECFR